MANSGTFDPDPGALTPQSDEFLAGVLALARISRVTVALESGANAGPALLAAARLTGHAETCLLFERWRDEPLPALRSAIAGDGGDEAAAHAGSGSLRDLLQALQARRRHSFLLIFNRFERLLAMPAQDPAYRAFEQAFVELAADCDLDLHMLLVLDEAEEDLLARLEERIPGIGDGCLRISPAAAAGPSRPAAAVPGQDGVGASRDRSFGRLLERLTAIAPAEIPPPQGLADADPASPAGLGAAQAHDAAQPIQSRTPGARDERDDQRQQMTPVHATSPEAVQPAPPAHAGEGPASPTAQDMAADRPATLSAPAPASLGTEETTRPATPRRKSRAWAVALALLVALGAGVFALRQPTPTQRADSAVRQAAPVAEAAPAPGTAPAPQALVQPAPAPDPTRGQAVSAGPAAAAPAAMGEPQAAVPASTAAANAASTGNTVNTASAGAAPPVSGPVAVYVHVRDARERDRVQSQARRLAGQGVRLVDIKITNRGPSVADLRYFHDEDRAEALSVQKALLAAGVPVAKLRRMNGFESTTRRRHFEAWLDGGAGQR